MKRILSVAPRRAWQVCAPFAPTLAALACIVVACASPGTASAQSPAVDSLAQVLLTGTFGQRASALARIVDDYPTSLPASLSQAVVTLITREAARSDRPTGEGPGEYYINLCVVAARTGDRSTIRPLVTLGGLGISGGIASFVVAAGASVLPLLDSVLIVRPDDGADVLDAYALMLARHGETLSASDSGALTMRVFGAAGSPDAGLRAHLAFVGMDAPFPELVPVFQYLAATDTAQMMPEGLYFVRRNADMALAKLLPIWNSLDKPQLVAALKREQGAACFTATGATRGHCETMRAQLDDLAQHLDQSNTNPATNAVKNFLAALDQAAPGLTPAMVFLLRGNAARVTQLIGG